MHATKKVLRVLFMNSKAAFVRNGREGIIARRIREAEFAHVVVPRLRSPTAFRTVLKSNYQ